MLQLKGIYKTFNAGTVNEKRAIDNLNLTLEDGDFVTIIGGNGAGKSTTLNLIAGVYPVDAGMIHLNGYDLTNLPEHKRARFLGRVFQDPMMGTAATMGIEENLALAYRRGQKRGLGHKRLDRRRIVVLRENAVKHTVQPRHAAADIGPVKLKRKDGIVPGDLRHACHGVSSALAPCHIA